ncbi:single-stranded DNA-binding protein [Nocardioides sp. Kera G14]|uniref:single-stranded DNA-binding protein n=1 Tax=Nocardioides sp. Kera G14 TaxID=2884264 RepID=UPI001D1147BE|nr:single-stranded DNA-binding protein [Nocardioides sp. Kera G14]UDY24451.1 single-stranded DNA-binding protein [Nocardioides sp. Kera G14]
MNDTTIQVRGYVGGDVVVRAVGDTHVANFRLASTPRIYNRATGEWGDGPTQWYSITAWHQTGLNAARSLRKGHPVFVGGRLTVKEWADQNGVLRTTLEVEADSVGHDLKRGSTIFVRNERPQQAERDAEDTAAEVAEQTVELDVVTEDDPVRDWRERAA